MCPTGKTSENQRKHLRDKKNLDIGALLSFVLYHLHKSQESNKPNLQAHSILKQVDQQTNTEAIVLNSEVLVFLKLKGFSN